LTSKDFEFVEHFVGLLQHFFALARISLLQAYSLHIFLQYKCEVGAEAEVFERWSLVFRGRDFRMDNSRDEVWWSMVVRG